MSVERVERLERARGRVRVPGDKSASHRALMISALAHGESVLDGLSPGLDVAATGLIVQQLGASVTAVGDEVIVVGPSSGLHPALEPLDCGNSGTTMRLMAGVVSAVAGEHLLSGDASLCARPMDRVARPLGEMGSAIEGHGPRVTAPLRVQGSSDLRAIDYHVPVASAQVKSAILFAALGAHGTTSVLEDVRTRSTTEDMFREAGVNVTSDDTGAGRLVRLEPSRPMARRWRIPADPSQAAFFCVLGVLHHDAAIEVSDLDTAPERTGFVEVLVRMGADLRWSDATTLLARSSSLHATEIHAHEVPSVDEVPVLAVAAAAAHGVSAFRDMGELRLKESDRFAGAMGLVAALGCRTWSEADDFFVEGRASADAFEPFSLEVGLDHRMVMAGAVAASAGHGGVISGSETVSSSYPNFFADLASLA